MMITTPIDVKKGWALVKKHARTALNEKRIFSSTQHQKRYRIQAVEDDFLLIERLDGKMPQKLTHSDVVNGLRKLNKQGGTAPRQSLHSAVANEAALVFLHPQLDWDAEKDNIITVSQKGNSSPSILPEPNYWAFLSTPQKYRIQDVIHQLEFDTWRTTGSKVQAGDWALIWKGKGREKNRGIIAFAQVLSDPTHKPSPNPSYYTKPGEGLIPANRVDIRYFLLPGLPLWLEDHPKSILPELNCAKATGSTVFKVTSEQWEAVLDMAQGWLNTALPSGEEGEATYPEGKIAYGLHRRRERNAKLIKDKKALALKEHQCLACEVCAFDFLAFYGDLGKDFIECHHTKPISNMQPGEETKLADLALVCANCHRMLHRSGEGGNLLSLAELKARISTAKE